MLPPGLEPNNLPSHVAIIMDGNGRWAKRHGLKRYQGHEKGADTVREIVRANREFGIPNLTLYAFSEENWSRSPLEIRTLMNLLNRFLESELQEMLDNGIRFRAIGRLYKLPKETQRLIERTTQLTSHNSDMNLIIALSYGGRQEILDAVNLLLKQIREGSLSPREITEEIFQGFLYTKDLPDPDLLIRTSGEMRISNFLLWQIAYTELYITPTLWPDFTREEYIEALKNYQGRQRRFGSAD